MNDQLTTEQMKAQGIAWLSSESWNELKRAVRYEEVWLPVDSEAYEELKSEGFIIILDGFADYVQVGASMAGHDYFDRFEGVYP